VIVPSQHAPTAQRPVRSVSQLNSKTNNQAHLHPQERGDENQANTVNSPQWIKADRDSLETWTAFHHRQNHLVHRHWTEMEIGAVRISGEQLHLA
jgi:hypothetical protein